VFRNELEKALFIDYSINSFRGNESVKGNIKDFFSIYNKDKINNDTLILSYLFNMTFNGATKITEQQYLRLINQNDFGVLSIAGSTDVFRNRMDITSIKVPEGCVTLEAHTFRGCSLKDC
ncbi:MAG: hypothetical protein RRZ69_07025, partial [Clostridia bacterium]